MPFVHRPPNLESIIDQLPPEKVREAMSRLMSAAEEASDRYLHWDELRHRPPPEGLTHEEWWLLTKMSRQPLLRNLPLQDQEGHPFVYAIPDEALRSLHHVDQHCSGEIAMPEVVTAGEQARQHYLVNSLMEEAIRSSQLEGATTSRVVAKELIRSGRPPEDRSERMIVNNYRAMLFMHNDMGDVLTPETVCEVQRILTEGTLENPDAAGRVQRPDEERVGVFDMTTGELIHSPPPAAQLPDRLARLCDFANEAGGTDSSFVHPVVRSILVHFWIGYDHPFEDGNGRTARALFYWSMRKQGYWLTEYLSISRILRDAPSQYSKAFVYSETDGRDTTYFLVYQLNVISRAIDALREYLQRKVQEVREVEGLIRRSELFNHRQLALLGNAIRNPDQVYTFRSHAISHNVTHETARHDLLNLRSRGYLESERMNRKFVFTPVSDLATRLREAER